MGGGGILVVVLWIMLLYPRCGRSRIHESEPALVTFNDRKKLFAEEASVRHFIHRRVPVASTQITRHVFQACASSGPCIILPAVIFEPETLPLCLLQS